ncbi:hypothetical protein [Thalassoroseus pseudoceratinae]|uniref:hypothetical protein n=1 Tax=Thalassoroseus pseudoceratinae TaxID=2713176 RepID=UPI001423D8BF|nr:hypothetical protein [Thalassoroseus pseudoceratinae]
MSDDFQATELLVDRRTGQDRRSKGDRVSQLKQEGSAPTPERRQKVERRRQIDPTTCERDYSDDEIEFMRAMDEYKRKSGRQFPTWSEVLEVLRSVGYRKVAEPTEILPQANS